MNRNEALVNIKKSKDYDVYIGRPNYHLGLAGSIWQNPFRKKNEGDRDNVIGLFREHLLHTPAMLHSLSTLEGKRLGCYCLPKKCHGDVILEYVSMFKDTSVHERELYVALRDAALSTEQVGTFDKLVLKVKSAFIEKGEEHGALLCAYTAVWYMLVEEAVKLDELYEHLFAWVSIQKRPTVGYYYAFDDGEDYEAYLIFKKAVTSGECNYKKLFDFFDTNLVNNRLNKSQNA